VDLYRQDVVIVVADRYSRSAKFVTSSELLYLLNLLYNMLSECCDDYKLIQLIPKEFRVVFCLLTYIYLELIPRSCHGSTTELGDNTYHGTIKRSSSHGTDVAGRGSSGNG